MNKIITLISASSLCIGALAQTPNPSFDTWTSNSFPTYDSPNSWNNANSSTAITGVVTCVKATAAADKHSGTAAVKLITKQIPSPFNQIVPGIVTTGTINTTSQAIEGGIAYTQRPDSITGWYKYTSQGGESGFITFYLFGSAANNTDTVAHGSFSTPASNVGTYTYFSAPLVYNNSNPVANSIWLLSSSSNSAAAASIGSTLFADDLGLVFNPATGINEQNASQLMVGPNPATEYIRIKNELNTQAVFTLYDATGRNVAMDIVTGAESSVSVNTLSAGLYSYSLTAENGSAVKTGKIIIQK